VFCVSSCFLSFIGGITDFGALHNVPYTFDLNRGYKLHCVQNLEGSTNMIEDHCQATKQVLLGAPSVKDMDTKIINVLIGTRST